MRLKQARQRALERQIARLQTRLQALHRASDRYARVRLVVFFGGILLALVSFTVLGDRFGWLAMGTAVVAFGLAVRFHRQIKRSIARHEAWQRIKSAHVARMTLDWDHIPATLSAQVRASHPFEIDLDLTGERSLHQLTDTAVTREGSERLHSWYLNTIPDHRRIQDRQSLICEVIGTSLFRDKLILHGSPDTNLPGEKWEANQMLRWIAAGKSANSLRPYVVGLSALAVVDMILVLLNQARLIPAYWIITLLIYVTISMTREGEASEVFHQALMLEAVLRRLYAVFQGLERHSYPNQPRLKELCAPFLDQVQRPSTQIRRIAWLVSAAAIQENPILGLLINLIFPWNIILAYLLDRYRANLSTLLPRWLDIWFELEAINSLANFAYLNPEYVFPEIYTPAENGLHGRTMPSLRGIPGTQSPVFRATALGHPLIPDEQKVCNDYTSDRLGTIDIITGSNMSGKSSFLRTVGINLCLAYAGGPVNAASMHTCLFRLFTCMEISDSLTDGVSYFYAEVKRLKALLSALDHADHVPVFFLIDEIFRGTNNRERLIGSRSYVRALVGKNGVGLLATHDLELVRLADEVPGIENYHFREEVRDGRMVFDYKLRPGPCPTTNALKIMQMEGLPVEGAV